jgi:hypothetical protein
MAEKSERKPTTDAGPRPAPFGRTLVLSVLTLLFAMRLAGQALVGVFDITFLPPFAHWYSGLMPYPLLLPVQLAMLALMVKIVVDVNRGRGFFAALGPRVGTALRWFAFAYAFAMIARYAISMNLHPQRRWFGETIPIWFHLVLAGYIYTLGRHYLRPKGRNAPAPAP